MRLSVALHKVPERPKLKFFLFFSACLQVWARGWCRRARSAGRHLLLQGVCVRPRKQQAAKHIHHLCPTHPSNQPLSGGLLRRHAQNQFPENVMCSLKRGEKYSKSTSLFLCCCRIMSFSAGSRLIKCVFRLPYSVITTQTVHTGRMKTAAVSVLHFPGTRKTAVETILNLEPISG